MNSDQPSLPFEVLMMIVELIINSYLFSSSSRIKDASKKILDNLYKTNKTFNNRLIPVFFANPTWGNTAVARAIIYREHVYLAQGFKSLSIHLDLPPERKNSKNDTRTKRIKDFDRISNPNSFPCMAQLEKVTLSSEGSLLEDLREMLTKTITLIRRPNLKILILDIHSMVTLFDIHPLELRYEMEVAEEKIWPEGLQEITFLIGTRRIPDGVGKSLFSKAATFAFQILGGMDILDILDEPDVAEKRGTQSNGEMAQFNDGNEVQQTKSVRKQTGTFTIDYEDNLFPAEVLQGIMSSDCFRFDPTAEELRFQERKGSLLPFKKSKYSKTSKFCVNLKGGLKVGDQETFDKRAWLLQSEEIVLEGDLKRRERSDFTKQKFFETDRVNNVESV